jgi:hypothetical protein
MMELEQKRLLHKQAGYDPQRCACVFDTGVGDSDPITECNYHRELRAENSRLKAELKRVWEEKVDIQSQVEARILEAQRERDAEFGKGLYRAIEILDCLRPYQWVLTAKAAIRVEIDKAKAGK